MVNPFHCQVVERTDALEPGDWPEEELEEEVKEEPRGELGEVDI